MKTPEDKASRSGAGHHLSGKEDAPVNRMASEPVEIRFARFDEVDRSEMIALMNHPLVRRHMPLMKGEFSDSDCKKFVASKERLWACHGYGPWAFFVDGKFAGWGGLQPENGEVDMALVLHPDYWGIGGVMFKRILHRAFAEMKLKTVTVLLPASRKRVGGLLRLGFYEDGELNVMGGKFIRYRLNSDGSGATRSCHGASWLGFSEEETVIWKVG